MLTFCVGLVTVRIRACFSNATPDTRDICNQCTSHMLLAALNYGLIAKSPDKIVGAFVIMLLKTYAAIAFFL